MRSVRRLACGRTRLVQSLAAMEVEARRGRGAQSVPARWTTVTAPERVYGGWLKVQVLLY